MLHWCHLLFHHIPGIVHNRTLPASPGRVTSAGGVIQSAIGGSERCWLWSGSETQSAPYSPGYSLEQLPTSLHTQNTQFVAFMEKNMQ